MAKQFLRVSTKWTKLAEATDSSLFFLNVAGTTVQIQLTEEEVTGYSTFTHPHSVGGCISQLKAPKGTFVYARARTDDPLGEGVLVMDNQRVNLLDVDNYRADIDKLTVQILKLTQRTTATELADVNHHVEYILALRELGDVNTKLSIFGMTLQNQILKLNKRLFAAERLVREYQVKFGDLDFRIESINNDSVSGVTAALKASVGNVMTTVGNLVTRMNNIAPKVDALYASTTGGIKEALEPVQASISEIHTDFTDLNNALVKMSSENSVDEINTSFNQIISTVSDNMVGPIQALRNVLVDLAIVNEKNEIQDTELDNTLGADSTLIIEPSINSLLEMEQ